MSLTRRLPGGRLAAAAALTLVLVACSDGTGGEADPSPTPSRPSSPSLLSFPSVSGAPTDDPTASPTPDPEPEPTNPCDLFNGDDYDQLVPASARPYLIEIPELSSTGVPYYYCNVQYNGYAFVRYGFSLTEDVYTRTLREAQYGQTVRSLDGVGDRAFYSDTEFLPSAYAELDGRMIMISFFQVEGRRALLAEPLELLAEKVQESGLTIGPAHVLPEGCPRATSPAVRRVLGEVAWARGGIDVHGVPQCSYRSTPARRTILALGASYYDRQRFFEDSAFFDPEAGGIDPGDFGVEDDTEVIDPPPGRTQEVSGDTESGVVLRTAYPRQRVYLAVTTGEIGYGDDRLVGSRAAVRRLAPSWMRVAEPRIEAYRSYSDARQPQRY